MHRPVILLTLALVTGILLGQAFLFFPWSTIAVIVVLTAGSSVIPVTARLGRRDLLLTAAGAVAGFAILVAVATHLPERHYRAMPVFDGIAQAVPCRARRAAMVGAASPAVSAGRTGWMVDGRTVELEAGGDQDSGDLIGKTFRKFRNSLAV